MVGHARVHLFVADVGSRSRDVRGSVGSACDREQIGHGSPKGICEIRMRHGRHPARHGGVSGRHARQYWPRARLSVTSGYTSRLIPRSFPPKRYFSRHHKDPFGFTIRSRPPESFSLYGFSPGLILRRAVSVSIGVTGTTEIGSCPHNHPRKHHPVNRFGWTAPARSSAETKS